MKIKKIVCIGAGYVGGPTMAVIADRCPQVQVTVIDMNTDRIAAWNSDSLPVYEPGLAEVVQRARGRNLKFINQADGVQAIKEADAIFISVNTPTKTQGVGAGKASDLSYVESCARWIAQHATGPKIIIEKSTMPVRTAERIKEILSQNNSTARFDILSNPEFLAEGTAIRDLERPERVLIGGESHEAVNALVDVYAQWVKPELIITTGLWSAELSKLAANAFLAQRVSSINSLSALCEKTGAHVDEVAKVVGSDSRVGPKFLKASVGFGGSCFKKDVLSLVYLCEFYSLPEVAHYWQQVIEINEWQKKRFAEKIIKTVPAHGRVAILGLAFKKETNDFRESAAIDIVQYLLKAGLEVITYDPKVKFGDFAKSLTTSGNLRSASTVGEALDGANAVAILTEWEEFSSLDWKSFTSHLKNCSIIYDGRNITRMDETLAQKHNLRRIGVGN
jgi:UDPglucose 6-dehydrogenase